MFIPGIVYFITMGLNKCTTSIKNCHFEYIKMKIFNFSSLLFETDFLVLLSMKRGSWTNAGVTNVEVDKRRSNKRQSGQTQKECLKLLS